MEPSIPPDIIQPDAIPLAESLKFLLACGADETYYDMPAQFLELAPARPTAPAPNPSLSPGSAACAPLSQAEALAEEAAAAASSVDELRDAVLNFDHCPLKKFATHAITGAGAARPLLVVITETPDMAEDKSGEPFCGDTGALLKNILAAMGRSLEIDTVAFPASVSRPAGGFIPDRAVLGSVRPFVKRMVELLAPEMILAMGAAPLLALFNRDEAMASAHGKWMKYRGIPLIPTFSLPSLLGSKEAKKAAWKDLQLMMNPPERSNVA
jgi:DNA polymerase